MRGAALLVLLAVAGVGCATGGRVLMSDEYQRTMLATSTTLITCDWGMTRWMPKTGAYEDGYAELNPLLGRHPSTSTIDAVFIVAIAANVGAYKYLPKWARAWWYTTATALEAANVAYFNPSGVCGDFGRLGRN